MIKRCLQLGSPGDYKSLTWASSEWLAELLVERAREGGDPRIRAPRTWSRQAPWPASGLDSSDHETRGSSRQQKQAERRMTPFCLNSIFSASTCPEALHQS